MRYLYVKFLVKEEIVSFKDSQGINSEFFTRGETALLLFLVHKHRELGTIYKIIVKGCSWNLKHGRYNTDKEIGGTQGISSEFYMRYLNFLLREGSVRFIKLY
ncbi:unnamed protein product [Rhizophagus irregularis]|nr:unnamed protein product [Rhizophagus irregularis]